MNSAGSCLGCGNIYKDPEGMAFYRVLTGASGNKNFNYHKSSLRYLFDIFLDLYVWLVRFLLGICECTLISTLFLEWLKSVSYT